MKLARLHVMRLFAADGCVSCACMEYNCSIVITPRFYYDYLHTPQTINQQTVHLSHHVSQSPAHRSHHCCFVVGHSIGIDGWQYQLLINFCRLIL